MKNLVFLFLGLSLFACKSEIQKNQAAVEGLAASWQTATNSVTELNNALTGDMNEMATATKDLILAEDAVAALKGDAATNYTTALENYKAATSDNFAPILNELNGFVAEWTAKTADVTALTEGLKSGKYEGNVVEKIAELNGFVEKAGQLVGGLTEKRTALKADAATAVEKLKMAYEAVAPKK